MFRKRLPLLAALLAGALVLAAAAFILYPKLFGVSWGSFVQTVQERLKIEDHPTIPITNRVRAPEGAERDLMLKCGEGQSVTLVGSGQNAGDFAYLLIEAGAWRLQGVRITDNALSTAIKLLPSGILELELDENCVLQSNAMIPIYADVRAADEDVTLRIRNAGNIKKGLEGTPPTMGVMVYGTCDKQLDVTLENSGMISGCKYGLFMDVQSAKNLRLSVCNTGFIDAERQGVFANLRSTESGAAIHIDNESNIDAEYIAISAEALAFGSSAAEIMMNNGASGTLRAGIANCIRARGRVDGNGACRVAVENLGSAVSSAIECFSLSCSRPVEASGAGEVVLRNAGVAWANESDEAVARVELQSSDAFTLDLQAPFGNPNLNKTEIILMDLHFNRSNLRPGFDADVQATHEALRFAAIEKLKAAGVLRLPNAMEFEITATLQTADGQGTAQEATSEQFFLRAGRGHLEVSSKTWETVE